MSVLQKKSRRLYLIIIIIVSIVIISSVVIYYTKCKTNDCVRPITEKAFVPKQVVVADQSPQPNSSDPQKYHSVTKYITIYENMVEQAEILWNIDELCCDKLFTQDDEQFRELVEFMDSKWLSWRWPLNKLCSYRRSVPNLSIISILKKIQHLPVDFSNLFTDKVALGKALALTNETEQEIFKILLVLESFFNLRGNTPEEVADYKAQTKWMSTTLRDTFDVLLKLNAAMRTLIIDADTKIAWVKEALEMPESSQEETKKKMQELSEALKEMSPDILVQVNKIGTDLEDKITGEWLMNHKVKELFQRFNLYVNLISLKLKHAEQIPIQPLLYYLRTTARIPNEHLNHVAVIILTILDFFSDATITPVRLAFYYLTFDNYYLEYLDVPHTTEHYYSSILREFDFSTTTRASELWNVITSRFH